MITSIFGTIIKTNKKSTTVKSTSNQEYILDTTSFLEPRYPNTNEDVEIIFYMNNIIGFKSIKNTKEEDEEEMRKYNSHEVIYSTGEQ